VQSEPRLSSVESKLSELQSAEVSLSIAVKKIEAQLTDYHKAVSDMLSSSSSTPISTTTDGSTNPAIVSPTTPTLSILDELTDRDRRKGNIIAYNLPESSFQQQG